MRRHVPSSLSEFDRVRLYFIAVVTSARLCRGPAVGPGVSGDAVRAGVECPGLSFSYTGLAQSGKENRY